MRLQVVSLEQRELPAAAFTLVALPDTQRYVENYPATFTAQTQYIVNQQAAQNIVFVTQEGDIVQNAENGANQNATEWTRADTSADVLHGHVPYSFSLGNHDYGQIGNRSAGNARYLEYFGPDRYRGNTWYGGASATGVNHYQYFNGGDRKFLHLNLQWEPTNADIAWAQTVVNANPGMPTIITTHKYLNNNSGQMGHDTDVDEADGNSGLDLWTKLVRPNNQIFMVLNGHYSGEYKQTSTNASGQPVFEMVADYQSRAIGGDGWLRLIKFEPDLNRISVKTYSPTLNQYETDSNSQFTFNVNFDTRFGPVSPPVPGGPIVTSTFRYGAAGYTGTVDTTVRQNNPTTAYGNRTNELLVDAATSGESNQAQVLLRFDNLFGTASSQIPAGAVILNAELVVQTINTGAGGHFHRLLTTFSNGTTWNTKVNGVIADNAEARSAYDSAVGDTDADPNVPVGSTRINVTRDIQAWASGAANRGWAMLPWTGGTDGWGIAPSEEDVISQRPQLRVEWTLPSPTLSLFQQGEVFGSNSAFTGTVDTHLAISTPTTAQNTKDLVVIDGPNEGTTRHALITFDNIVGTGRGRIPANAQIQWARLYLTTPYDNENAPGGGAMFYRMLQPWSATATWQNSFSGNGIQADNVEAMKTADFNTGAVANGSKGFDVAKALQYWVNGGRNYGWGLLFNTSDAWMFGSAEKALLTERPRLVVSWTVPTGGRPAPNDNVAFDLSDDSITMYGVKL